MTRPAFKLSDAEARVLVARLPAITAEYPLDQRGHRPFVRAFIRLVYDATGKTYSPAIYRRLLDAYAPDRRPSTATLAVEKELLADELVRERDGAAELAQAEAPQLATLIRSAVSEAVGERPSYPYHATDAVTGPDTAYWRERVTDAERALTEAQAQAARLAGELLAANAAADILRAELAATRQALHNQGEHIARLADAVEESRRFSMRAIDEARGEARAWRERCAATEAQAAARAREDNILLETFRQLAYQRGATIPPMLRKGST
jgi:hypothetical protein